MGKSWVRLPQTKRKRVYQSLRPNDGRKEKSQHQRVLNHNYTEWHTTQLTYPMIATLRDKSSKDRTKIDKFVDLWEPETWMIAATASTICYLVVPESEFNTWSLRISMTDSMQSWVIITRISDYDHQSTRPCSRTPAPDILDHPNFIVNLLKKMVINISILKNEDFLWVSWYFYISWLADRARLW